MTTIFSGGSEMGHLMQSLDWAATPLGPVKGWPRSLRSTVRICLTSRVPTLIGWGSELVLLYNDACRPIIGVTKHPYAMGQRGRECRPELWEIIGPMLEDVLTTGTATWSDDKPLLLDRNGYLEECYFSFSYSPIEDDAGGVGGVFCTIIETTQRVLDERRLRTLRELANHAATVKSMAAACQRALVVLADAPTDVSFAALYLTDPGGRRAQLTGTTSRALALPTEVTLDEEGGAPSLDGLLAEALRQRRAVLIDDPLSRWPQVAAAPWLDPPRIALVLPVLVSERETPAALLVVISPRRALDEDYRGFLELVAVQIASGIAAVRVDEAEQQRAQALVVRAQLEQILEGIKDDFVMYDDAWRYVYVNDQAARSLGFPKEQLIGQRIWDLFPDAIGNRFYQEMLRAKAEKQEVVFEHYYAPWGKWIENRAYPIPNGMLLFAADITSRKQVEEALRVSDERARLAITAARLGTWYYDLDGELVSLDERMRTIWGVPVEVTTLPLATVLERVHPDDRARVAEDVGRALDPRSSGVYESEYRIGWPNGTEHWVAANGQVQFTGQGEERRATSFIGTALDITDRKQVEAVLRESEARFRHMADHAPVMVWVTAPDGLCTYLSKSWYAFTGQTPEQSLGFGWTLAVHPDDRLVTTRAFTQANERHTAFELEYQLRRSDGLYRWVIDSAVPRRGDDGTFLGYIGSVIDITERKQAELERLELYEAERAARAAAERAARERDELLAYIAHDLKNPLTALLGATQLLQRRLRTPAVVDVERLQRGLSTIEQTASRLAAQLNELQDVAGLQARQPIELQWHSIDLVALIERVVSLRQAATEQHQIRLETSLAELPCMCDPFRIERVVSNLLGNAVKYSPQGGEITVRITDTTDGAGGAIIEVQDYGMGIPAADLPHIFERFYRGQNVDGQSGTGLGLASAQAIIQQHGGKVSITSELGQGTVVTVRLPLKPSSVPPTVPKLPLLSRQGDMESSRD